MNIAILGAGLIGAPIALDLAADPGCDVWIYDNDPQTLHRFDDHPQVHSLREDLSQPRSISNVVREADFVVNALPGHMGFHTLEAVISAGKNIIDISFFPENPMDLYDLAVNKQVTAVIDCGVAPGLSHLLVGFADSQLDQTQDVKIYVGGLPEKKEPPFAYKAVFSPADVLEEYTRPARFIKNNRPVIMPALSEIERIDFDRTGTLDAFNTDGLRTLATTISAPNMVEKTLRYPGHVDSIKILREAGFLSKEPIRIHQSDVIPFDMTAKILSEAWRMNPGDRDITVMRIIVAGRKNGRNRRFVFELYDRFDEDSGVHSMARTTGYTATMMLRLLSDHLYKEHGVIPPERIGRIPKCVNFMLRGLKQRGITISQKIEDF